jgi:hypothetical protein
MSVDTPSVVTDYEQQENFETGRVMGRIDREWMSYYPPPNSDAAMLAGYEAGWSQQDLIETQDQPNTADEAWFELQMEYLDL